MLHTFLDFMYQTKVDSYLIGIALMVAFIPFLLFLTARED
jgi:hypothetical protein